MLTKRSVLLAKLETTYNTDPTPTAANDAVLVEDLQVNPVNQEMHPQPAVKNTLGTKKHLYGRHLMQITGTIAVKGSGTAGTAPEFGPILQACGLGETIVAGTSVAYDPVSSGMKSVTIYAYLDGHLHKITGCRGNLTADFKNGPGKISFTLTGHDAGLTDVSIVSPTFDATVPPVVKAALFTIDSYSAAIEALTFDLSNELAFPSDINASDGYGQVQITGRDVQGSFNPEAVLKATHDFLGKWTGGNAMALNLGVIGATAGNKYQLTMPAVSYRDAQFGDRDGIRTYELPYGASETTGDNEIQIIFT